MIDPKPKPRIANRAAMLRAHEREKKCRICSEAKLKLDAHHLVPKSLRGDDVIENLIILCHDHHMEYEFNPNGKMIIGSQIRSKLSEDELNYIVTKKSEEFLNRYYPIKEQV